VDVRVRLLALVAVLALALAGGLLLLGSGDSRPSPLVPAAGDEDPFAWDPGREEEFVGRAAQGFSHVLYTKSPDGVVRSAERTARFRGLIERVAQERDLDADTLEGIVLLESAGRPEARAGDDLRGAVGLTQILAETGQNLLDMRVDLEASRRLTRQIGRAERRGQDERSRRLRAARRRVDERFDPQKALAGAGRYLEFAREQLGRDDLAVVSYHMGVGNLQNVLAAYGDDDVSYAEVYFDSSPLRHRRAWSLLSGLGDDSATYLWRVEAAKDIMRRWREDPVALELRSARMNAKNSAEEVLHPPDETDRFDRPEAIRSAVDAGDLVPLRERELAEAGIVVDEGMGELADRVDEQPSLYRALRPEALALLVYLARGTEAISDRRPLVLTSTVRDAEYQAQLARRNREATRTYSLHTTGWAFDIERTYAGRGHSQAFQFMLDRLQALNLVAWVREPAAIHITAGPDTEQLLGLLEAAPDAED
jgi:hypothetical protein